VNRSGTVVVLALVALVAAACTDGTTPDCDGGQCAVVQYDCPEGAPCVPIQGSDGGGDDATSETSDGATGDGGGAAGEDAGQSDASSSADGGATDASAAGGG